MARRLDSSNVKSVSFNNATKLMAVNYENGRTYLYPNTSLPEYRRLTKVKSPGKWIWRNKRDTGAPYLRVR